MCLMVWSHCKGPGKCLESVGFNIYDAEMFTLVQYRDRNQDPLFHIMPFPAPSPVLVAYSVNQPLDIVY